MPVAGGFGSAPPNTPPVIMALQSRLNFKQKQAPAQDTPKLVREQAMWKAYAEGQFGDAKPVLPLEMAFTCAGIDAPGRALKELGAARLPRFV